MSKPLNSFASLRRPAKLSPTLRSESLGCVPATLAQLPAVVIGLRAAGPRDHQPAKNRPETPELSGTCLQAPWLQRQYATCSAGQGGREPGAAVQWP